MKHLRRHAYARYFALVLTYPAACWAWSSSVNDSATTVQAHGTAPTNASSANPGAILANTVDSVQAYYVGAYSNSSCPPPVTISFTLNQPLRPDLANTIATDNPGVGARILDANGQVVPLVSGGLNTLTTNLPYARVSSVSGAATYATAYYPYTIQLVRTSDAIASPIVHVPILTFQYINPYGSVTVDTHPITVRAALIIPTCTLINTPPVALGTVSLASLTSPGDTGPVSPAVHIQATCPGTLPHLSIGFVDSHNHANQTSILSNTGSATNVGVQLLQADAASPLVLAHNYAISNPPNVTFDLHARMINNGTGPVQAGSVQATALYTLSYW